MLLKIVPTPNTPTTGYASIYVDLLSNTLRIKYPTGSIWEITLNEIGSGSISTVSANNDIRFDDAILLKIENEPETPPDGYVWMYVDSSTQTLRLKFTDDIIWEITLNSIGFGTNTDPYTLSGDANFGDYITLQYTSEPCTPPTGYTWLYIDNTNQTLNLKYTDNSIWEVVLNDILLYDEIILSVSADNTAIYSPSIVNFSSNIISINFVQYNVDYYRWYFDYGNYPTVYETTTTSTNSHIYEGYYSQQFSVKLEAYSTSGNVISALNQDYIVILGTLQQNRYASCKNLSLVDFLPSYIANTELYDLVYLFEDYLNNMYNGICGWLTSSTNIDVNAAWSVSNSGTTSAIAHKDYYFNISGVSATTDATTVEKYEIFNPPDAYYPTSAQKISILDKINRIVELQDVSVVDEKYIPYIASNLGYDVNISRDEIGVSGTTGTLGTTELSGIYYEGDLNKYLRFVVENLPTWYKIKTTENSIRVLLYSYGLVGYVFQYYTDSYKSKNDGGLWKSTYDGLDNINNQWFPTSHFGLYIDYDQSSDVSFETDRREKVVRAVESIRPVNTVFEKLIGYVKRQDIMDIAGFVRFHRYKIIIADGYANEGNYGMVEEGFVETDYDFLYMDNKTVTSNEITFEPLNNYVYLKEENCPDISTGSIRFDFETTWNSTYSPGSNSALHTELYPNVLDNFGNRAFDHVLPSFHVCFSESVGEYYMYGQTPNAYSIVSIGFFDSLFDNDGFLSEYSDKIKNIAFLCNNINSVTVGCVGGDPNVYSYGYYLTTATNHIPMIDSIEYSLSGSILFTYVSGTTNPVYDIQMMASIDDGTTLSAYSYTFDNVVINKSSDINHQKMIPGIHTYVENVDEYQSVTKLTVVE